MSREGFTLIELLIVIAIIGILAAVLIPNLLGAQKRAYDAAAISCAHTLIKAIAIYRIDHPNTINTPGVSDLYGSQDKDELCGTEVCTKLPTGSTVLGVSTTDGNFEFEVKHINGKNTYLATPLGLSSQ